MKRIEGGITTPKGFIAGGTTCGLKASGRPDLMILAVEGQNSVPWAGVFTKNQFCAAPVIVSRERLNRPIRAITANSGNANAGTGPAGIEAARSMARITAECLGCGEMEVLVASTGVIGRPLSVDKVTKGIEELCPRLSSKGGSAAAEAILTTDTVKKECAYEIALSGGTVRIGGCAKGSGMIRPNMATMLAWLTTDLKIDGSGDSDLLQNIFSEAVERTFNCISVDGDTSTNDMAVLMASGASNVSLAAGGDQEKFASAVEVVCRELAHAIVRDGEGASRFLLIDVKEARSFEEARRVGLAVADSNLFKCALFGGDPNWGRILSAMGNSGVSFEIEDVRIQFQDVLLFEKGMPTGREAQAAPLLKEHDLQLVITLGTGSKSAQVACSDLTYDYVRINAEYTT